MVVVVVWLVGWLVGWFVGELPLRGFVIEGAMRGRVSPRVYERALQCGKRDRTSKKS